jgi:NAD(P)H-hydrate epimerase
MPILPTALFNVAQIKALEYALLQEQGISSLQLMLRAGEAVFQQLRTRWPDVLQLAIFCGAGNNAGDGYVVATLALRAGLGVSVISVIDPEALKGDALTTYQGYLEAQGEVMPFVADQPVVADVIVDALLGTGLNKPVVGNMAQAVEFINMSGLPVMAIDIPSGLNADTGNIMTCSVIADCTVTFIGLKQGLFTGQVADYCGEIAYESLGVSDETLQSVAATAFRVERAYLTPRQRYSYKGHYGHVLVIGGEQGYCGAVRMAGEAALRIGAGLVSIATRVEHASILNLGRPELMCHGVENAGQLSKLLAKASVIVMGPGLGQSAWAKELFVAVINAIHAAHVHNARIPLLVDADALHFLTHARIKYPEWILTPHPGEAAQLLHCSKQEIEQDRFASASAIQLRYNGITVLKGPGTLIVSEHEIAISNSGNPGMASGGMGDVLTGVIAGLLAQGMSLKDAAQQGVYLHGLAADKAAEHYGERGLLASDLMPYLSQLVA